MAPITRPGSEHRHVYLPAGTWVHWWTGERIDGPAHVLAHAPLGRPALYARANAPIPLWPALPHTGARAGPADAADRRRAGAAAGPVALRGRGRRLRAVRPPHRHVRRAHALRSGRSEGDYVPARVRLEVVGRGVIDVPESAAEVTLP